MLYHLQELSQLATLVPRHEANTYFETSVYMTLKIVYATVQI